MLGISAISPDQITCTPIQIHITSGFTCALMIGLPVSGLRPVYTRYKSSLGRERFATIVESAGWPNRSAAPGTSAQILAVLVDVQNRPLAIVVRLAVLRVRLADQRVVADLHFVAKAHLLLFVDIERQTRQTR